MKASTTRALGRLLLTALAVGIAAIAHADQPVDAPVLQVSWKQQATVRMPGVTRVLVVDDAICQADIAGDAVRLNGLNVGDTVMFVWIDGMRTTRVVRVVPPADAPRAATLSRAGQEALGQGRFGMTAMNNAGNGAGAAATHEYWDWQQKRNGARLSVHGFSDTYAGGGQHAFNLTSLSVQHATDRRTWSFIDFTLDMAAVDDQLSSLAQYGAVQVRGVDFTEKRDGGSVEVFAGATVPPFFLDFGGTRALAGARVNRTVNPRLTLFATAGAVSAPTAPGAASRSTTPFGVSGFAYRPSAALSVRATAGVSTRGPMGDVRAAYTRGRFSGTVAATDSAAGFALNQVQLLTSPEAAVRGVATIAWPTFALTTSAHHGVSKRSLLTGLQGTSDTLSQAVQVRLPLRQQLSGSVTRDSSSGSLLGARVNTRGDVAWSAALGSRVANTLNARLGNNHEATELNSYREFAIRDAASVSLPFGSLEFSLERQQLDPSGPARIRQVLDQLPPSRQDLFRVDPVLFLSTVDLPNDIRDLLSRVQPASTAFSVGGHYTRGALTLSPTFSVMNDSFAPGSSTRSYVAGYSATWQIARTWQIRSSLSSRILYYGSAAGFRRTNVFTIGIDKSLAGLPRVFGAAQRYAIEGHVFRDTTVDGIFTAAKPGVPGVRIRLDDGRVATTDDTGHFRFTKVQPGVRHLSVDLTQFPQRVRMTTPSEVDVEVVEGGVQVDFGMVNFARIIGTIFTDCLNDGRRQSDAPGLAGLTVRISGGSFSVTAVTDGSGEYEVADVPPGDYTVAIADRDLPADHVLERPEEHVHVDALATAVVETPVRALRSIAGRVVFKDQRAGTEVVEPLAGVTIAGAMSTARTDADGRFILRDLPAGLVEIRVVPSRELPQSVHAPAGTVRLGNGPSRIENATITITNPALVDYLAASAR